MYKEARGFRENGSPVYCMLLEIILPVRNSTY